MGPPTRHHCVTILVYYATFMCSSYEPFAFTHRKTLLVAHIKCAVTDVQMAAAFSCDYPCYRLVRTNEDERKEPASHIGADKRDLNWTAAGVTPSRCYGMERCHHH